jgi:hypothetical protein
MFHLRVAGLFALTGAILPVTAFSQTIVTDRPDFVEAASTVGKGSTQIEAAVAFAETEANGTEVEDFGTPFLLRVGFADAWEARVETFGYRRSTEEVGTSEVTTDGVSDFAVGVKWAFFAPESGNAPAMGALVHLRLPIGSNDFQGDGTVPSLRISAEWDLGDDWGIGIMPGIRYDRLGDERFVAGLIGAVAGKGLTDTFRVFAEIAFEQIAKDQNGGDVGFVDFGGTFLLNPRWQLDASTFVGITDQAPDYGFSLGVSGLFPG